MIAWATNKVRWIKKAQYLEQSGDQSSDIPVLMPLQSPQQLKKVNILIKKNDEDSQLRAFNFIFRNI